MNVNLSLTSPRFYPSLVLKKTQRGFSLQKALEIIEARKPDLPERSRCLRKESLRAILITEGMLGAMIALTAFLVSAERAGGIEHQDKITNYKYYQYDPYSCFFRFVDESDQKDGFLIDHSKDRFVSNFTESVPIFFLVALLPPSLLFVIFKILEASLTHFEHKKSYLVEKEKNELLSLLKEKSSLDHSAPLKGKLFLSLFDSQYGKEDDLSLLNFSQVRSIKKERFSIFQKALSEQKFSPSVIETFNKIEKVKTSTPELILKALNHSYNRKYLIQEPEILEILILELTDEQLSEPIQKRIRKLLKKAIEALKYLPKEKFFTILKSMRKEDLSLQKAYEKFAYLSYNQKPYVTLNFGEEEEESLLVSHTLLIRESFYFEIMLCGSYEWGSYKESNTELQRKGIHLKEVDRKPFQQIINFFVTGNLSITHQTLFPLLEIASKYFFLKAHQKLENYFLQFFDELSLIYQPIDLLEICDVYQLKKVKNKVDFNLSLKIPEFYSSHFITHLTLVTKYSLNETLQKIAQNLENSLLSQSEEMRFCSFLVTAFQEAPKLLSLLEIALIDLLEKKPTLLKEFFEEAKRINFHYLINIILKFAEEPKYAHISLRNWILSPGESEVQIKGHSSDSSDEIIQLSQW